MKKFTLLFCFLSVMIIGIGCGGNDGGSSDDPPTGCSSNFTEDFLDEINNINTAIMAYAADQSEENCNAVKDAYNAYLDALEGWEDCANFYNQLQSWQEAIDTTRESIDTIC